MLAGLLALVAVVGFPYVSSQQRRFREQAEAQLSAVADLKVAQVVAWRAERLANASVLNVNRPLARALRSMARRTLAPEEAADRRAWLDALAEHYGYTHVLLLDPAGSVLGSARDRPAPSRAHLARHLAAVGAGGPLFTDVERDEATGQVHLDLVAPIRDPDGRAPFAGAVLLRLDPADALYPMIQGWPTPSASAETLLVRVEADVAVVLNAPRHREGAPLSVRLPLSDRRDPAVRFALGEHGVTTGIDYRGAQVLAAGRPVPGTDWILVAKIDAAEMLAPGAEQVARAGAIVLLVMATLVAALAVWWRHRSAVEERAWYEEQRVREAHARHLELLSAHANDVVLLVDEGGRIVRANDRVPDCHGWSAPEILGWHLRDLRAPGHCEDVGSHIARIREQGQLRYETFHRRRDGTAFPVEVSARGFEIEGKWFFQAIVRDITERREALRAISYQAELLRNLHEAVIGLDERYVIRAWNTAAERIFGLTAEQAIGKRFNEALPSEYKGYASFQEFCEALDRNGRMSFEVRRRLAGGTWVEIEAAAAVLRGEDGRVTGYVSVNRDVTLRKRAEAALRQSQERLSRILETSVEGIWIVRVDGTTEFVNDRGAQLLGARPDDALGRAYVGLLPEALRAEARADHEALLRGETVKREIVLRRPDSADVWINLSWSALHDGEGRVAGGVGLFMDVTEHRQAREQLLHAQKMDAVGRLASGVAHDFNNLLVSILSCSRYLLQTLDPADPLREEAAEIKEAGERAAELVRQLLTFGRKNAFRPVTVSVNTIVRQIETILRRAAGDRVSLTMSLAATWATRIDPGQLEQVLLNLAVNARDAMPDGGQLRIATYDVVLDAAPAQAEHLKPGRYAKLTVTDSGCGIAADVLPRIFEPFFTTKPEGRGTGLGLSTVYGIVREAGGGVTVASAIARGTSFIVYLPAAEDATLAAAPPQAGDAAGIPSPDAIVAADGGARRDAATLQKRAG